MVPFYIFYSMFGLQRIGDLAWAALAALGSIAYANAADVEAAEQLLANVMEQTRSGRDNAGAYLVSLQTSCLALRSRLALQSGAPVVPTACPRRPAIARAEASALPPARRRPRRARVGGRRAR